MNKPITLPLREQIKAHHKTVRGEAVDVPEWGCTVMVRGLTAAEVHSYRDMDDKQPAPSTWEVAIKYCVDEAGEPLFEEADAEWLQHEPARALLRIAQAYQRLNTLTEPNVQAAVKN